MDRTTTTKKGNMKTITITTKTPVQYHGWTLPAGSAVTVQMITLSLLAIMNRSSYPTVTAQCELFDYNIALPTYAFVITQFVIK